MNTKDPRVLLAIDDKRDNLIALKAVIADVFPSTTVLTALSGSEGIALALAESPDVILLDMLMPGMDGFEVCRQMKSDPRLTDIPVLFLTATQSDPINRTKVLEAGGEVFLSKPIEEVELVAQVRAMTKISFAAKRKRLEKGGPAAVVDEHVHAQQALHQRAVAAALDYVVRDDSETRSPEQTQEMLQDLRVHQIELQMQNEELCLAQVTLEESRARYFDLYDLAPVGYCRVSEHGLILEANLTAATLLGVGRRDLVAQPITRFIARDDADSYYLHRKQLIKTGTPQECELRMVTHDGTPFWAHLQSTAPQGEGGAPVHRIVISDITARKQAEEARSSVATQLAEKVEELQRMQATLVETERLRAMGQMAAGVAHDFNNALMGVLGQAQLMQLALEREPDAIALNTFLLECLARQEQAAQDAAETVRKIRGATRPRDMEAFAPVSLGEIVEQVIAITQPRWKDQAEAAGVRMTVQTALTETPPVMGHAAELREALTNLFFNALDAMPQGGTLTITTRQVSGPEIDETPAFDQGTERVREWVEVIVTDTGVGMPPEVHARLFEPFFTTKGVRGTGLGLSMVKGIIGRHEGEVTVRSAVGQGTTIALRLPVAHVAPAEVVPSPIALLPIPGSLNILVIDDEPLLAETLGELLGVLGHKTAIATSGEEGLTRLATTRFDMVLTDLGMPGMSGWEVAQAVKASWPQLPVILVTGWGDALERARLEGTGVDLVLSKPYRVAQLKHALAQGVART